MSLKMIEENFVSRREAASCTTTGQMARWLQRQINAANNMKRVAFSQCLDQMNFPFDLKERLLKEVCFSVNVRELPFEAELNALQALSEQLFTRNERSIILNVHSGPSFAEFLSLDDMFSCIADPLLDLYELFDSEFSVGAIVGCARGVCFECRTYYNGEYRVNIDVKEYAKLFHPSLYQKLVNMPRGQDYDKEREEVENEIMDEYWYCSWGMINSDDSFWNYYSRSLMPEILSYLGYAYDAYDASYDAFVDTLEISKEEFLEGYRAYICDEWIPSVMIEIFSEVEEEYSRIKNALVDTFPGLEVPDCHSLKKDSLLKECLDDNLSVEEVIHLKKEFGIDFDDVSHGKNVIETRRLINKRREAIIKAWNAKLEIANKKSLSYPRVVFPQAEELVSEDYWLRKFPALQSFLNGDQRFEDERDFENREAVRRIVLGIFKCIVNGKYHFDMAKYDEAQRRDLVHHLVQNMFRKYKKRANVSKRKAKRNGKKRQRK